MKQKEAVEKLPAPMIQPGQYNSCRTICSVDYNWTIVNEVKSTSCTWVGYDGKSSCQKASSDLVWIPIKTTTSHRRSLKIIIKKKGNRKTHLKKKNTVSWISTTKKSQMTNPGYECIMQFTCSFKILASVTPSHGRSALQTKKCFCVVKTTLPPIFSPPSHKRASVSCMKCLQAYNTIK